MTDSPAPPKAASFAAASGGQSSPLSELIAAPDPLLGTMIGERYQIEGVLGHGGMGTVYLAEHVLMEKQVALKVLHPDLAVVSSVMDRFQKEAVALSRIDHPNVVSATDFGKLKNGAYYLALQYIEGTSLADQLKVDGAFQVGRALTVALQVASALAAAHSQGIVHRDLKPHNVMLARKFEENEQVKVLDFGLAKLRTRSGDGPVTQAGSVMGTPHYMAPEQVTGEVVDGRADIYSLGVITYELLAGKRPFEAEEVRELMAMQVTGAAGPLPPEVPEEVAAVVMQMLEKHPADRFQTADEVVGALRELLAPPSNGVSPPGPWFKQSVAVGRWSLPVWGLLLPALTFLVLFVVGAKLSQRTTVSQSSALSPAMTGTFGTAPSAPPEPDRWPSLISGAEFGDKNAIEELLRIPAEKRDQDVWLVLARGQMVRKQTDEALELYREAIHRMPELSNEEDIAKNVRLATLDARTAQKAVTVAAESLGSRGVDILFSVWATTSKRTPASALAERYLEHDKVREKSSPQVKLALALRDHEKLKCEQILALLKDAKEYGDTRSLRPMWQLKARTGCGETKREDCYPCLRETPLLAEAIKLASKRIGPEF